MAKTKTRFSFRADDIVKNPTIVDRHRLPFLQVYEWTRDTSGENTARVTNLLAKKGWVLHQMAVSQGGGWNARVVIIYTVFRRKAKE